MGTLWTALVWGLGASLGAAVGGMVFVIGAVLIVSACRSDTAKKIEDINERSVKALLRRNELSEEMVANLRRIADAAEGERL